MVRNRNRNKNRNTGISMSEKSVSTREESKAVVNVGRKGLELSDMDSMFRFAKAVSISGLAPKGLDKPESIFVAVQMGLELGLSPMAALQNIGVINGRPGIYGDAALALVRASGLLESYSESFTGDGEARCCIVRSTRKGSPDAMETKFGVVDAKRAKLWGKPGPWSDYPDRILKFRARGFNLRDQFGDVLKGFRTTEELADIPADSEQRFAAAKRMEPSKPEFVADAKALAFLGAPEATAETEAAEGAIENTATEKE